MSVAAFELTPANEASAPPAERDEVRLLVAQRGRPLVHDMFRGLPDHLRAGDLLVVNTSATMPAALSAGRTAWTCTSRRPSLATTSGGWWSCGAAARASRACRPRSWSSGTAGRSSSSPRTSRRAGCGSPRSTSRCRCTTTSPRTAGRSPTRHLAEPRPLEDLQTVFADEPGSAEMPSAGRPFSQRVLDDLFARGVQVAPLMLHTGVSRLELGERPYPERYRVPALTATRVNAHRAAGGRVIAIGTTVVRALETVAAPDGEVAPGAGWTSVVVTPERGVRAVDGLLTGWHEPDASHLLMLEAVGGRELIERSYAAALGGRLPLARVR